MDSGLVETTQLTKRYGEFLALRDCSLTVQRGEIFGLLGPNGSGKSTLIRLLMGFLKPTSGRATIAGLDCHRQSVEVHRRVAYMPGDARLFRQMNGDQVLQFFSQARPDSNLQVSRQIAERLQLDLRRPVAKCSTGMRQKLALSAVLGFDCSLVILDEPTANLDPTIRSEVLTLVTEARDAGRTIIFSSHVLSEVEQACDRVAILRYGDLVHMQAMSELRRQHRIRARLTGPLVPPPAALAEGLEVRQGAAGELTVETPGELSPLLGWLAQLPLEEVQIEPVGLQAVYDRYHSLATVR